MRDIAAGILLAEITLLALFIAWMTLTWLSETIVLAIRRRIL